MRFAADSVGNAIAWVVIILLIGAAFVVADVLGPFGLLVLGVAVWLVCSLTDLNQDVPTWSVEVFRARMSSHGSPEQRDAMLDERQRFLAPVRFYRWCGIVVAGAGAIGLAWQQWTG